MATLYLNLCFGAPIVRIVCNGVKRKDVWMLKVIEEIQLRKLKSQLKLAADWNDIAAKVLFGFGLFSSNSFNRTIFY